MLQVRAYSHQAKVEGKAKKIEEKRETSKKIFAFAFNRFEQILSMNSTFHKYQHIDHIDSYSNNKIVRWNARVVICPVSLFPRRSDIHHETATVKAHLHRAKTNVIIDDCRISLSVDLAHYITCLKVTSLSHSLSTSVNVP